MARAGLRALEFYDPATQKHGQAHMQARYVHLDTRMLSDACKYLIIPLTASSDNNNTITSVVLSAFIHISTQSQASNKQVSSQNILAL